MPPFKSLLRTWRIHLVEVAALRLTRLTITTSIETLTESFFCALLGGYA